MILIADSGATKTDWACVSRDSDLCVRFTSQGYNPNYISRDQIIEDILKHFPIALKAGDIKEIYFYGAGVTPLQYPYMEAILCEVFPYVKKVFVSMDTLASCRALLGRKPGFAAILGTGSNTCLYDGCNQGLNVDSCGFILGDEGSGAYLGKRLITDYIRHNMPDKVYKLVAKKIGKSGDELLDIIYTKPFPNRFCAQYAKFIRENIDTDPYFVELVNDAFTKFFDRIVTHYPDYQAYSFNAVGSIAYYFRDILKPIVEKYGMQMGVIAKAPLEGLIKYHLEKD